MKYVLLAFCARRQLVVALAPGLALAQTGPAGDWELTIETPQGANTVDLSLKLDGDKLSGDLSSQMGSVPVTGTATGQRVAAHRRARHPGHRPARSASTARSMATR